MRQILALCLNMEFFGHTTLTMKCKNTINDVKTMMQSYLEKRISVRVELGRNKRMEFSGVLTQMYPALFAITPDEKEFKGKTVYAYSDVLMGTVKLKMIS